LLDTEIDVAGAGWVGLSPEADHELRIDITSTVIARFLGSSITTARKYVRNLEERSPRDEPVRRLCHSHMRHYDEFYRTIEVRTDAPLGVFAFDMAMIRSRTSIELMLITARQGFLIEPCLMARSIMEQFAYALRVWGTDEDKLVFSSKPQSLIGHLRNANPNAGRAYGMLSRLAHYDPKMHYSFIGGAERNAREEESSTIIQRSWQFKITSLAWLFFVLDLKFRVFQQCYGTHEHFACLRPLDRPVREFFDEFFEEVNFPAVRQVRSLL
jgi:hypothetical protein